MQGLRDVLRVLPRRYKRALMLAFDFVALLGVLWVSYSLRLNQLFQPSDVQLGLMLTAPALALLVFYRMGLYRAVIRYLPEHAIWTIAQAMTLATLLWVAVLFLTSMTGIGGAPRSIPLLYWALGMATIAGSRFAAKALLYSHQPDRNGRKDTVAIYGAGEAGAQLASALRANGTHVVAGFIDDDPGLQGRHIGGVAVFAPEDVNDLIEKQGVKEIILSMPSIDPVRRQKIFTGLSHHPVKIRSLPAIADLAAGKYLINQLREIDIDDLLGRSSVPADPELVRAITADRVIMVTGAGGSIGSELSRLIGRAGPRKLVLLEANEHMLYQIERQLALRADLSVVPVLGSAGDDALVRRVIATHGIEVVFHAAAHKHVTLVEANIVEGVQNNVFGTWTLAQAALEGGVETFVLISTDKAVNPSSVMGATKRWAELIMRHFGQRAEARGLGQRFCAVRFGNVLGSNGSVVPLFKEQIEKGGPVTLTDEGMTRYFMSIHEAAELIVQAGALSEGGDIFLLDMGEPVRIRDLAENMIRLAGLTVRGPENPEGDIEIEIIGARPGEKIHEELFYEPSLAVTTAQPKIMRAPRGPLSNLDVEAGLSELRRAVATGDEVEMRKTLFGFLNARRLSAVPDALSG